MTSDRVKADIESSIWIACPPEKIWDYLVAVSNDAHWRDEVIDARWVSDPPHGVGSLGLHIIEGVGDWPWKTTTLEEPRVMAWEVTGGRFEGSHAAYRMEPEGEGSRFTMEARMKRGVFMSLLMLILKGRIERQNAIDLKNLRTILEAQ